MHTATLGLASTIRRYIAISILAALLGTSVGVAATVAQPDRADAACYPVVGCPAVDDLVLSLADTAVGLATWGVAFVLNQADLDLIGERISWALDTILELAATGVDAAQIVLDIAFDVLPAVLNLVDAVGDVIEDAGPTLTGALDTLLGLVLPFYNTLLDVIGDLVPLVLGLGGDAADLALTTLEDLMPTINEIADQLGDLVGDPDGTIATLVGALQGILDAAALPEIPLVNTLVGVGLIPVEVRSGPGASGSCTLRVGGYHQRTSPVRNSFERTRTEMTCTQRLPRVEHEGKLLLHGEFKRFHGPETTSNPPYLHEEKYVCGSSCDGVWRFEWAVNATAPAGTVWTVNNGYCSGSGTSFLYCSGAIQWSVTGGQQNPAWSIPHALALL